MWVCVNHTYVYIYMCDYIASHTCTEIPTYTEYMCIYIYIHIHIYNMRVYIHVIIYIWCSCTMYIYLYTVFIYICGHMYIHIYIYMCTCFCWFFFQFPVPRCPELLQHGAHPEAGGLEGLSFHWRFREQRMASTNH